MPSPYVCVVRPVPLCDLPCGIIIKCPNLVGSRPGEVQAQTAQLGSAVVTVAGNDSVGSSELGPPSKVVILERRQGGCAILSDGGHHPGSIIFIGHVKSVRPGQPGPAAGSVILTRQGRNRVALARRPAQPVI